MTEEGQNTTTKNTKRQVKQKQKQQKRKNTHSEPGTPETRTLPRRHRTTPSKSSLCHKRDKKKKKENTMSARCRDGFSGCLCFFWRAANTSVPSEVSDRTTT